MISPLSKISPLHFCLFVAAKGAFLSEVPLNNLYHSIYYYVNKKHLTVSEEGLTHEARHSLLLLHKSAWQKIGNLATLESSRSLVESTCTVNLEILTAKIFSVCRIIDILANINFSDFIVFILAQISWFPLFLSCSIFSTSSLAEVGTSPTGRSGELSLFFRQQTTDMAATTIAKSAIWPRACMTFDLPLDEY